MAGSSRSSLILGLVFLALAFAEAWSIHTGPSVFKLLAIVVAAFVAGVRLGPFLPGGRV
jgi:hypothetical protein